MKFPAINQFRHVVRNVVERSQFVGLDDDGNAQFDNTRVPPTLRALGTVKLHGTNAGVTLDDEGQLECWSRTRRITEDDDNQGFARFVMEREDQFLDIFGNVQGHTPIPGRLMIYGEWCGKGIMSGCAIHELDKRFIVFAMCMIDGEERTWVHPYYWDLAHAEDFEVYSIHDFATFDVSIDFANPETAQNALIDITNEVESGCPVGRHFGVHGVGEGVVWQLYDPSADGNPAQYTGSDFWFKVKGAKHSVSKVKVLAEVDVEKIAAAKDFAEMTVTEERCLQGISMLEGPVDQKATGKFLKWVVGDILKEESDRLDDTLTKKDVTKHLSNLARTWFFKYLDTQAGI